MNNVMMQRMMTDNNIQEEAKKDEETKEKNEKGILDLDNLNTLLPILSAIISMSNLGFSDTDILKEKIHNLDKRIAVCEALLSKK